MAGKPKALCILNPAAGKLRASQDMQDRIQAYIGREYDISFYLTTARGDAARAAAQAGPEAALIICCGGDGTLSEVINGMRQAARMLPVFLIPCGSTNDVAKTLGIPAKPQECARLLSPGCLASTDAGRFNENTCFTYIAAFGAFTELSYATSQSAKNRWGHMAYLLNFFKGLFHVRSKRLTAYVDGQKISGRYLFGSITNSLSIGGILSLQGQGVSTQDGMLELLLVERPKTILLVPYVALKLLLKKYNTKGILLQKCREISFRFEQEVDWTVDGEYGGKMTETAIKSLSGFYQIYSEPQA